MSLSLYVGAGQDGSGPYPVHRQQFVGRGCLSLVGHDLNVPAYLAVLLVTRRLIFGGEPHLDRFSGLERLYEP